MNMLSLRLAAWAILAPLAVAPCAFLFTSPPPVRYSILRVHLEGEPP
ncbi:MAG: hypothetical protein H7839_22445 [Magnetococcus sp. YQC-5]